MFFYAGHGLQVSGRNYLVPVDARLQNERDLDFEAVVSISCCNRWSSSAKARPTSFSSTPAATIRWRAIWRARWARARPASASGLAQVQTGVGTFIAYSTQPGNVALDGQGRNSPFTAALPKGVKEPGRNLTSVMIDVRKEVLATTSGKQVPWDHSALTGDFYFHLASAPGGLPQTNPRGSAPETRRCSSAWNNWSRSWHGEPIQTAR